MLDSTPSNQINYDGNVFICPLWVTRVVEKHTYVCPPRSTLLYRRQRLEAIQAQVGHMLNSGYNYLSFVGEADCITVATDVSRLIGTLEEMILKAAILDGFVSLKMLTEITSSISVYQQAIIKHWHLVPAPAW